MLRTSSEASARGTGTRGLLLSLLLAAAAVSTLTRDARGAPTAEAVATAKSLVGQGRSLRAAGDHAGARDKFRAAFAVVATPIIGVDLGNEHLALGELREAREVFLEVTQLPTSPNESPEGKTARSRAAELAVELERRVPSIRVTVTGATEGADVKITIDERIESVAAREGTWRVNPGSHRIAVSSGAETRAAVVTVVEGESKVLSIDVGPAKSATTATTAPPLRPLRESPPSAPSHTVTWVAFGVGGAGLLVGGITAALALSRASSVKTNCVEFRCPPEVHDDYDSARSLGSVATVSLGIGVAAAAVGVVTLIASPAAPSASSSATTGAAPIMQTTRPPIASAVLSIGPMSLEVRGAF